MADKIPGADKKVTAGICGILLGAWGVHRFILGDATGGIIRIVLTLVTCGVSLIIGLSEGNIYLTKADEDFVNEYITNQQGWF